MKVKDVTGALESFAPLALQEEYDNAGLSVGNPEAETTSCLVCLDITPEVIGEANSLGIPLIISHHPLIFKEIKQIREADLTGSMIIEAIRCSISIYSMHTNLDNTSQGVNRALAGKLGLGGLEVLRPVAGKLRKLVTFCPASHAEIVRQAIFSAGAGVIGNYDCCSYNLSGQGTFRANEEAKPYVGEISRLHFEEEVRIETILPEHLVSQVVRAMIAAHPYEEVAYDVYPLMNVNPTTGAGMKGLLPEPVTEHDFILKLKDVLGVPSVRHSDFTGRMIEKVALCGGAGGFLLRDALAGGADAFVTSDLRYHQFFEARGKILMVDAGHFETEQFTVGLIAGHLKKIFPNFAVHISKVAVNPVNYL